MNSDINVFELKEKMDQKEDFLLLDVRESYEYDMYNIGAKLIPLGFLINAISELEDYKDKEVVVHCRSGMRSATAKAMLNERGFTNVRNLIGGILAWQEAFEAIK
jgi:rhodanese-related sulfurtransferase